MQLAPTAALAQMGITSWLPKEFFTKLHCNGVTRILSIKISRAVRAAPCLVVTPDYTEDAVAGECALILRKMLLVLNIDINQISVLSLKEYKQIGCNNKMMNFLSILRQLSPRNVLALTAENNIIDFNTLGLSVPVYCSYSPYVLHCHPEKKKLAYKTLLNMRDNL